MRLIAGLILSLAVAAVAPAQIAMLDAGSMAHFQSGGGWSTSFLLFNVGNTDAQAQLNFYDNNGQPNVIPIQVDQPGIIGPPASQFSYTLKAGSVLTVKSTSTDPTGTTGWAKLQGSTGSVTGYLIFQYGGEDGSGVQEGIATAETRNGRSYVLGFDNTGNHFTSYALANLTNLPVNVNVTARDALTGNPLSTSGNTVEIVSLPAMGHHADLLSNTVPLTKFTKGTVEFTTQQAGQISVLGLRFTQSSAGPPATYAFTSTPPILKQ